MKNYYQILGIDYLASLEEIKKAYKFQSSKLHPDKHKGDVFFEEKFKEILEAYEILSNIDSRKEYDLKFGFTKKKEADKEAEKNTKSKSETNNPQDSSSPKTKDVQKTIINNKILRFFKESSSLKLIAISIGIAVLSYFIEKPLPSIFLGLRLFAFVLFVYAVIRFRK